MKVYFDHAFMHKLNPETVHHDYSEGHFSHFN